MTTSSTIFGRAHQRDCAIAFEGYIDFAERFSDKVTRKALYIGCRIGSRYHLRDKYSRSYSVTVTKRIIPKFILNVSRIQLGFAIIVPHCKANERVSAITAGAFCFYFILIFFLFSLYF